MDPFLNNGMTLEILSILGHFRDKSRDKSKITNYRPISLIHSQFVKIFEKIIKIKMISFIDKYDLIHKSQFGFEKIYIHPLQ